MKGPVGTEWSWLLYSWSHDAKTMRAVHYAGVDRSACALPRHRIQKVGPVAGRGLFGARECQFPAAPRSCPRAGRLAHGVAVPSESLIRALQGQGGVGNASKAGFWHGRLLTLPAQTCLSRTTGTEPAMLSRVCFLQRSADGLV